ncbi:MAG: PAS domain S-box protein [Salinivirgaceae bacterium]|nr:PAS domain S-box protein [Salinivirgaceae bacterium]
MKLKMSVKTSMIVSILLTSIVTFSLSTYYCATKSKKLIKSRTQTIVGMNGTQNADAIAAKISNYFSTLNAVASLYSEYYDTEYDQRKLITNANNRKVLEQNPDFIKLTDNWNIEESEFKEVSGPKLEKLPNQNASAYLCQLSAPINYDGMFVGEVAASIIVDSLLSDIFVKFADIKNLRIYLASGHGDVLYSENSNERGKPLKNVLSAYYRECNLEQYIENHEPYTGECKVSGSEAQIVGLNTITLSANREWIMCVLVPKSYIMGEAQYITLISTLLLILCFIILGAITFILGSKISKSLKTINAALVDVSDGDIKNNNELKESSMTDINNINESMKSVISGLIKAAEFSEQIGNGNLDTEFTALSANDKLGNALINMRDNLKKTEEEAKERKIADEKVNWATSGLAKFGEILHTNIQNINDLSYEILRNLIKYIDVNQGAIYVLDDTKEEPEYEMTTAIAYDRRKFMQKRFAVGEDLVGRCAYEHKTIYMTDIPKDYINITSGMGSATASTLLLVPLVLNDDVFGIIELASFQKLEDYKINFVEKLAESIASTISTVKINERTNNLLNQSKVQAEELASKEEEMRQNMEELQATQEEAARRENESNAIIKVINDKMVVVEYDMEGSVTNVNDNYAKMLGSTADQIIGKKSDEGVDMTPEKRAAHLQMWNMLRRGQVVTETNHITLNNKDLWIQETYTPVFDQNETAPYKVVKVGIDITDHMKAQEALNDLEKEKAEYAQKIAELENQQSEPTAAAPKKSGKAAKTETADDNEFNAEVGEQELIALDSASETGIIEIDEQLKQLAELANTVYTTFRANKSKKEMKDTLRSLSDFAAYHFGTIEGYADESGFSDAKQMKQSFKDFSAKINDFAKLYTDGKVKSADALMLFMNNWMKANFAQMKLLAESLKK